MDVDADEIEKCVEDSFEEPGNYQSDNKILREDAKWQRIQNVHTHPAITINNETYTGDFNGKDIGRAICASFKDQPAECLNDDMTWFLGKDEDYKTFADVEFSEEDISFDLVIAGVFILFINLGMVCIFKKTSKKSNANEIQMEVNEQVSRYFSLRGEEATNETANTTDGYNN